MHVSCAALATWGLVRSRHVWRHPNEAVRRAAAFAVRFCLFFCIQNVGYEYDSFFEESIISMIKPSGIRKYARALGREFRPERVILFGSYARGSATEDSDVDLMVIMNHDKPRNIDQAIAMRLRMDAPFPMDLLVKRPGEVASRLSMNDTFIKTVLEDGQVLYG